MQAELSQWVDRLKDLDLPAMALTMQRVPQLLDSPNTTNADYQRIISRDPGFTLAIFRAFGNIKHAPKEPPGNLMHAIALLGLGPVSDASKNLPILKETVNGRARQELHDCYSRAGHAAWYAYSLGRYTRDPNPEEMEIAALLHELAEMMLWSHAKEEMKKIQLLEQRGLNRDNAALEILGFTLDELTEQLAEVWRLPTLAREAMRVFGAFQTRSLGVIICSQLARESAKSWASQETMDIIEVAAEYQKRDFDETQAVIHSVTAKAARDLSGLPIPLSAYELLQLKPKGEKKPDSSTSSATDQSRLESHPKPPPESQKPAQKKTQPIDVKKPASPSKPQGSKEQQAMKHTFKDLKESVGLERILFANVAKDSKRVKARFVVGADASSPLRQFQFELGEKHLFNVLMRKPQSFWLNASNKEKYLPLIPEALLPVINNEGFFIMSLFSNGQPKGLIYGDKKDPTQLNRQQFDQFKVITKRLGNQLD